MASDPLDDYLEEKEKSGAARESADMEAFQSWQTKPTKRNLSSLLR